MTSFSRKAAPLAAALALAAGSATAALAQITGAGSTFVYPILSKWAGDFRKLGGEQVNYQSIGSGGGIAQIKAGTVDFGATDKPLTHQELAAAGLAQFPIVIGGIVPVVNIPGIAPGQLKLSGPLMAGIFLGDVKRWDDPQIRKLNPGLKLPAAQISVVHRSDSSGTTFNMTHYFSQVSNIWRMKAGEGTSVQWPTGIGGKGNEGVAAYVNRVPNSIGYVEYAYVIQNRMKYAVMQNSAGRFVAPNARSFQAAAASADWSHAQDFYLVMTNAPGANSYPITATTFVLMYKQPKNPQRTQQALKFFRWSLEKGQPQAAALDYVPLPAPLVKRVEAYMAQTIK
ncbi:MAG TPA: phosphate ABC transporter substrate-binding protein PstS [Allosphingosinicella sp.]|jgi:phosphate transport system substrate-binding protein